MSAYVPVPEFFSSVYLVDFSPSLCEVARKRFERLGWKNVKVICQDARRFHLEDHEEDNIHGLTRPATANYYNDGTSSAGGAELLTMSYSLSMIVSSPDNLCYELPIKIMEKPLRKTISLPIITSY